MATTSQSPIAPNQARSETGVSLNVNSIDKRLQNLLIDYADYRNFHSLLEYIKAGGSLDIQLAHSYQLTTPLCEASKRYDTCAMESMFEEKVDVNFPDGHGNTPLFLAAKCHKIGSVYMLLQQGAAPDICNRLGQTALTVAMENFSNHCAELLIEAGASVNVPIPCRRGPHSFPGQLTSPLLFALLFCPSPFPMAYKLVYAGSVAETLPPEAVAIILNRPGTKRQFLDLLIGAGFRFHCKGWMKEQEIAYSNGTISNKHVEFLDIMREHSRTPSSLQILTRAEIRRHVSLNQSFKGHLNIRLQHLTLPKYMIRYLKLQWL